MRTPDVTRHDWARPGPTHLRRRPTFAGNTATDHLLRRTDSVGLPWTEGRGKEQVSGEGRETRSEAELGVETHPRDDGVTRVTRSSPLGVLGVFSFGREVSRGATGCKGVHTPPVCHRRSRESHGGRRTGSSLWDLGVSRGWLRVRSRRLETGLPPPTGTRLRRG